MKRKKYISWLLLCAILISSCDSSANSLDDYSFDTQVVKSKTETNAIKVISTNQILEPMEIESTDISQKNEELTIQKTETISTENVYTNQITAESSTADNCYIKNGIYVCKNIVGLDFEAIDLQDGYVFDDGFGYNNILAFDKFTYVVNYQGETYTSENDPEKFDKKLSYISENRNSEPIYKKIEAAEIAGCNYKCTYYIKDEMFHTIPLSSYLFTEGPIKLKGIIAYAENDLDYGRQIYGDEILFFPYANSLKNIDFPMLHSENINAVYYSGETPSYCFYGETIPFKIDISDELFKEIFNGSKFKEVTITFENIEQSWFYDGGSGWSPCKANVVEIVADQDNFNFK